jgi:hypothetical protein
MIIFVVFLSFPFFSLSLSVEDIYNLYPMKRRQQTNDDDATKHKTDKVTLTIQFLSSR